MLSEERKELEKTHLGASEIGDIVGFGDPWRVWARRCAPDLLKEQDRNVSYHIERGIYGEPFLRNWLSHRLQTPILESNTFTMPKLAAATPDGLIPDDGICELKFPSRYTANDWYDDNGDLTVPNRYLCQVQWQLMVVRHSDHAVTRCCVAAFLDGDLKHQWIKADEELQGILYGRAEKFWRDHIEAGVPPKPQKSDLLKEYFKVSNGKELVVSEAESSDLDTKLALYVQLGEQLSEVETVKDKLKLEIQYLLGEHDLLKTERYKATWKNNKSAARLNQKSLTEELLAKFQQEEQEQIVAKHTAIVPGARVFRVVRNKQK